MPRLILAAGFAIAASQASAQDTSDSTILCIGELSTGFSHDGGGWKAAQYRAENVKFIVKPSGPRSPKGARKYIARSVDPNGLNHTNCTQQEPNYQLVCGGMGIGLVLDFKSMRFIEILGVGFQGGENNQYGTPRMTMGQCTALPTN